MTSERNLYIVGIVVVVVVEGFISHNIVSSGEMRISAPNAMECHGICSTVGKMSKKNLRSLVKTTLFPPLSLQLFI